MLDIKLIRDNPDLVKTYVTRKKGDPTKVDQALDLDIKRRKLLIEIENLRGDRNKLDKTDVNKGKQIKTRLKEIEPELKKIDEDLNLVMRQIPNLIAEGVPDGKDDSENVIIRKWGTPKKFDFKVLDHVELGEKLGLIDIETAGKVSGPRFAYLKGNLALMEYALVMYSLKKLQQKGFTPVVPPVMIKPEIYIRMARLDPGQEEERYFMPNDNLYLVGSAEHTLGPLHLDQTLEEKQLPIRYVGFSTAFRREAGTYGKDTRGILRVHQFDKVEMESFALPENGLKEQDYFVSLQEEFLQDLQLPYQVVMICTGDMGGPDMRQIDINTWMPGQNLYRETHTSDYMGDYQSRRLNTRVKYSNGATAFVHMNDATYVAIGRTLIAILENYQNADGSVTVPEVLRPYLGIDVIKPLP